MSEKEKCYICGNIVEVLSSESLRETLCPVCRAAKKNRDLAKVIVKTFVEDDLSLSEAAEQLKDLYIYEAQGSGPIHNILKLLPNYTCSEYFDDVPSGSSDKSGIRCEDLQKLTFPNNTFDLIITQDVLEHVANPEKAFLEINRVLKPSGVHIFTVPVHEGRKTVKRARIDEQGNLVNLLPPVYHGDPIRTEGALVYTDFGDDLIDFLESNNIPTEIACHSKFYDIDKIPNVDTKEEYEFYSQCYKERNLLKYFKYNSIVFISEKSKFENVKMANMLELTGERFLPWMEGAEHHYEHIHRYAFASQLVKGKKVLDLACGEGYGSYMLSKEAEYVIGVDIDEKTIEHAHNKYTAQNLSYIQGSILEIPIQGKEKFDVIVCFEAIEHVEEHDKLLYEVKRLLKKNGLFVVSSPNKKTYSDDPSIINPFHKKELYFNEFRDLLNKYFQNSIFFGQKVYGISNIWPFLTYKFSNNKEFLIEKRGRGFYFSEINKKNPKYFIAIASDKKFDQESFISSNLLDVSNILIGDLEKKISTLTYTIREKDKNIAELKNQAVELKNQVIEQKNQIIELNNALQSMRQSIMWQLLMKYNNGFVERVLPQGSSRRRYYDALLIWMRGR